MTDSPCLAIILAAGEGTRMKSRRPKVLHEIAGRSMLAHVLAAVAGLNGARAAIVIAPGKESVAEAARAALPGIGVFVQDRQLGTAHAVLAARSAFNDFRGDVLVLYGDTPLIRTETLERLRAALRGAHLAVLGFEPADPTGYGRLLRDASGALIGIREEKDAEPAERAIRCCNSGVMAFRGASLPGLLDRIGNANAKSEFYLTDAVALAHGDGLAQAVVNCVADEVSGVNDRAQLAAAEAVMQTRLRAAAMAGGATLIAPDTVTLAHDTRLGGDVVVEPSVIFGPGVSIGEGAHIRSFSYLEEASVAAGAVIGPYARLRPGAEIGPDARIGNFVEIKKARVEEGAKVNHLTYIGDARVGAGANIGAGTITCNYDGFNKRHTDIGAGVFIGSNSALVAPVRIGDGAYVGAGSVITKDVPGDDLALTRAPQETHPGWAARFRTHHARDGHAAVSPKAAPKTEADSAEPEPALANKGESN